MRFALRSSRPPTTDPISFALSPDGRQIVFVASGDGASRLWLRSLDSTTAQPLAGTEGAAYPFWSPDSASLGFFADSKLKRIDIGGGAPQVLANAANGREALGIAREPSCSLPVLNGPLFKVPATGGESVAVTRFETGQSGPSISAVSTRWPTFHLLCQG